MVYPHSVPAAPSQPAWDITFTRLTQALRPQVEACAQRLLARFQALGLRGDTQVSQTPRGLSTFLAVMGQRGLICIVDITLIDGMAVGHGPCGALDIRLLDACGDVVAQGLGQGGQSPPWHEISLAEPLSAASLERAVTAVYVASLAHFELLQPLARQA
ncbi:hypothetical protein LNV09_20480 [Paucibacter sp. B2R-40]|uniref:hypothetical protein n=1 Tax=Paucibacter sp. B2R-40 TaxID=2893554 RepID=UPI0021E4893C|nr:hypothetical protein [Paucibacter sp. B2R-40]MCV2356525.1 hypothetical protein [Paucibacter sp. B2R-40]